ncbi:MAG: hypothetical protein ACREA9_23240 [Pyrinomonadaceae bacterium]
MPLTPRTIDVSVHHTLGVATAWDRVLRWLNDNNGRDPNVKELKSNFDHAAHRAYLELNAYGYLVKPTITVTDSLVAVTSAEIDCGFFETIGVGIGTSVAEHRITKEFTEMLR